MVKKTLPTNELTGWFFFSSAKMGTFQLLNDKIDIVFKLKIYLIAVHYTNSTY